MLPSSPLAVYGLQVYFPPALFRKMKKKVFVSLTTKKCNKVLKQRKKTAAAHTHCWSIDREGKFLSLSK